MKNNIKLVVALSVQAHTIEVRELFKKAGVPVFSETEIRGVRNSQDPVDPSNWFGSDDESDYSMMSFGFMPEQQVERLIKIVNQFNQQVSQTSPVRIYQIPVEKSNIN